MENTSPINDDLMFEADEAPLVEASFRLDAASWKKYQKKPFLAAIIFLVCGTSVLICNILSSAFSGDEETSLISTITQYGEFIFGVFFITFGILSLIKLKMNIAHAAHADAVNYYRFFPDYVLISSERNGEIVGQVKSYHNTFVKVREVKNYFMLYPTASTVYLVLKTDLSSEDCEKLRGILPLKK